MSSWRVTSILEKREKKNYNTYFGKENYGYQTGDTVIQAYYIISISLNVPKVMEISFPFIKKSVNLNWETRSN